MKLRVVQQCLTRVNSTARTTMKQACTVFFTLTSMIMPSVRSMMNGKLKLLLVG